MNPRGDEVYLYDAFTFAEYRGQNLYPTLLQRILDFSRQQGLRRALIFVLSDNTASIRGVQKAGFREFQRVTYRNILGFARYAYRPQLNVSAGLICSLPKRWAGSILADVASCGCSWFSWTRARHAC